MNKIDYKVYAVYTRQYKTDDLGYEINPKVTFRHVLIALLCGQDIYELLGVGDSLVRERVFGILATIVGCDYGFIYDLWLRANVVVKLDRYGVRV